MNSITYSDGSVKVKKEKVESAESELLQSLQANENREKQQNRERTANDDEEMDYVRSVVTEEQHSGNSEASIDKKDQAPAIFETSDKIFPDSIGEGLMTLELHEYPDDNDDKTWLKLFPKKTDADYALMYEQYITNVNANTGINAAFEATQKKIKTTEEEIKAHREFRDGYHCFQNADNFFREVKELKDLKVQDRRSMIRKHSLLMNSSFSILPLRILALTADPEILDESGNQISIKGLYFKKLREKHRIEIERLESMLQFDKERLDKALDRKDDLRRRIDVHAREIKLNDNEKLEIDRYNKKTEAKLRRENFKELEKERKEKALREQLLRRGGHTRPVEVGEETIYAKEPTYKVKHEDDFGGPIDRLLKAFHRNDKEGRKYVRELRLQKRIDHQNRKATGEDDVSEDDEWDESLDGTFSDESQAVSDEEETNTQQGQQQQHQPQSSVNSSSNESKETTPSEPTKFVLSWSGKPVIKSTCTSTSITSAKAVHLSSTKRSDKTRSVNLVSPDSETSAPDTTYQASSSYQFPSKSHVAQSNPLLSSYGQEKCPNITNDSSSCYLRGGSLARNYNRGTQQRPTDSTFISNLENRTAQKRPAPYISQVKNTRKIPR